MLDRWLKMNRYELASEITNEFRFNKIYLLYIEYKHLFKNNYKFKLDNCFDEFKLFDIRSEMIKDLDNVI